MQDIIEETKASIPTTDDVIITESIIAKFSASLGCVSLGDLSTQTFTGQGLLNKEETDDNPQIKTHRGM